MARAVLGPPEVRAPVTRPGQRLDDPGFVHCRVKDEHPEPSRLGDPAIVWTNRVTVRRSVSSSIDTGAKQVRMRSVPAPYSAEETTEKPMLIPVGSPVLETDSM